MKSNSEKLAQVWRVAIRQLREWKTWEVTTIVQEKAIVLIQKFLDSNPEFLEDLRISLAKKPAKSSLYDVLDSLNLPNIKDQELSQVPVKGSVFYDGKYPIGHISWWTKKLRDAATTVLNSISLLLEQETGEKWEYFAKHDSLTRLMNRFGFIDILNKTVFQEVDCVGMCFDFNKFKSINDTYWHKIGDDALRLFADVCREVCEEYGGFIARTGGDEFMGLFAGYNIEKWEDIAQRIQSILRNKFISVDNIHTQGTTQVKIENIPFTVSIGVTDIHQVSRWTTPKEWTTPLQVFRSNLLHRADKAADTAKNHPETNHVYVYDDACNIEHVIADENKTLRVAIEALLRSIRNNDRARVVLAKELPELLIWKTRSWRKQAYAMDSRRTYGKNCQSK